MGIKGLGCRLCLLHWEKFFSEVKNTRYRQQYLVSCGIQKSGEINLIFNFTRYWLKTLEDIIDIKLINPGSGKIGVFYQTYKEDYFKAQIEGICCQTSA
ncbi:MAG: hypothetical protein CM1200mP30_03420 [Pseudomonadota bacterium]|nr:MAG: hypothetical protein CM1200mP30_03420 [Pseudomonadota bacterium]